MRHLLNTFFVTSDDLYLSLENENVVVWREKQQIQRIPLLNLENIIYFGYQGASPALLGACAEKGIGFCFLNQQGKFLARVLGSSRGNVLLRKKQYRVSDDPEASLKIARNMIVGKISNARTTLMRGLRDHPMSVDKDKFTLSAKEMLSAAREAGRAADLEILRGIEGTAAKYYFACLDDLILHDKNSFSFQGRKRRPPADPVNALLSFTYTLLAHDCAAALEAVGLDAYVGFLHRDRPGRESLALDMMEEFRSVYADKFVLKLINMRIIGKADFEKKENGSVLLKKDSRRKLLSKWQERKKAEIKHPFLGEKVVWGLLPYVQALLLSRYLRGDLDGYPPFLVK